MNKLIRDKFQDYFKEFGIPIKDSDIARLKEESEIQSAFRRCGRTRATVNYLIKIAESK